MTSPRTIAVIPARYQSARFPGKPLAAKTGKPLIQHVVEQVRLAKRVNRILVATDDKRILDAVNKFNCEAIMTHEDHPNGTCRIAEAITTINQTEIDPTAIGTEAKRNTKEEIIVNVQGDEPQIDPKAIDHLIEGLASEPYPTGAPMATIASEFAPHENPNDPNIVKLIVANINGRLRAIYFSRSLIPYDRNTNISAGKMPPLKHVGLYAYRSEFLLRYIQLPPTPLEQTEMLEQLRAIEHGYPITVVKTNVPHHGIDTPQQYDEFVRQYNANR